MKRLTFPKSARLLNNGQFRSVLSKKMAASDGLLTLFAAENQCGHPRVGISISRSAGGAVVRNRMKRLIREAYRLNQRQIPQGWDYVVMLSPSFLRRLRFDSAAKMANKSAGQGRKDAGREVVRLRSGLCRSYGGQAQKAIMNIKLKEVEKSFLSLAEEIGQSGRMKVK
jgi:ribonuclease P protein component